MRGGIQGGGDAGRQGARVARGAHARVGHAPCPTGERTTMTGTGQWAGPCCARPGERQVKLSLSLSVFSVSVFYFYVTSGLYLKYQNVFKNPENNCGLCLEYSQQPSLKFRIN